MATDPDDPYTEPLLRMASEIALMAGADRTDALIEFRRSPWWDILPRYETPEIAWLRADASKIWDGLTDDEKYPEPSNVIPFDRGDDDSRWDTAEGADVPPDAGPLGFKITDWSTDRYAGEAPPIVWLCENTIPLGVPALFAAMGGVGKSFIALDIALEIAAEVAYGQGRKILGGNIMARGSVVVLNAEDGKDSIHRRLAKIDPGTRREDANGRVFIVPLADVGGPMPLISGGNGQFMKTEKFDALMEQLEAIPDLKLIVIDPLQAFVTSDITKDPAAGQFMWSSFAQLCARTGATVIVCHHMRKEGSFKISTADEAREAIRGSTALIDGARATYALWGASTDDAQRICLEAGVEVQPKRVVNGAVVKSNDDHDWDIHTYIRADSGLLLDATDIGKKARQKTVGMTYGQLNDLLNKVDERWRAGRPFSTSAQASERFIINFVVREYGVSKDVARKVIDDWIHNEMVASSMVDAHSKMTGLKVLKWPD